MPKLDTQNRLTIPLELRNELCWKFPKEIALCYNPSNNSILLCDKLNCNDKYVIALRKLDSKGRLFFPNEAIHILNATPEDLFIVCLKQNQIMILKR